MFPTNDDTSAATAADRLVMIARQVRQGAAQYADQCDKALAGTGALNAHDLLAALAISVLQPSAALWPNLKTVGVVGGAGGVLAQLRARFPKKQDGSGYATDAEVQADLDAAQVRIQSALAFIVANTPTDAQGFVSTLKVVNNAFVQRTVTNGTQANITLLNNLRNELISLRDAFGN